MAVLIKIDFKCSYDSIMDNLIKCIKSMPIKLQGVSRICRVFGFVPPPNFLPYLCKLLDVLNNLAPPSPHGYHTVSNRAYKIQGLFKDFSIFFKDFFVSIKKVVCGLQK